MLDNTPESVSRLLVHPYENILVAADGKDGLTVWDHRRCAKLGQFANRSRSGPQPASSTSLAFINPASAVAGMLMVGADDGVIRYGCCGGEGSGRDVFSDRCAAECGRGTTHPTRGW